LHRFVADPDAVIASSNVAGRLHRIAAREPHRTAIFEPRDGWGRRSYHAESFFQLLEMTQRYVQGLSQLGITRGTRTVLMVPPSHEFVRLVFALLQLGAVPVMVDPGMGIKNLSQCLAEAEPEAFIGVAKAHVARWLYGWAKATLRIFVSSGFPPWPMATTGALRKASLTQPVLFFLPRPDDPAAILFTSGSTGVPKGAVYTHGMFCAQVEQLQRIFGIQPGEVDLCTFPLFALFAPALGMTSVIPRMDFTRPAKVHPREICNPVIKFHATNLFGSPALLNQVGRVVKFGHQHLDLMKISDVARADFDRQTRMPTLKRVLSAGAPVSPEILERFAKLLSPGAQIFTPYGATEALPVAVIGSDEVLRETRHKTDEGAGTCVGRPVPDIEVRIIRISDEPIIAWSDDLVLPPGEIGEIAVYGPVVTGEYFRRPDLTALAKIPDPVRGRAWHRMGDVGYVDNQGRLWFCGRKSQRVVTPERTYFTEPVEAIFNAHPAVFRTALVGVYRYGRMEPVLCVELEKAAKPPATAEITRELLELGTQHEHTREIATVLYHAGFPVDIRHNSKIFREQLAAWAAEQLR
jgi:acyl-CoA synthetase (AMP-forming)/AMP-acid ligase II